MAFGGISGNARNPNHFRIRNNRRTCVNSEVDFNLTYSDFFTLLLEYGNATSGVFDLKMRPEIMKNMNSPDKLDLMDLKPMAEGPISKKMVLLI